MWLFTFAHCITRSKARVSSPPEAIASPHGEFAQVRYSISIRLRVRQDYTTELMFAPNQAEGMRGLGDQPYCATSRIT